MHTGKHCQCGVNAVFQKIIAMIVEPKTKALEILEYTESVFLDSTSIKLAALNIVEDIIEDVRYGRIRDWPKFRHTGEEMIPYWLAVKSIILA